MFLEIQNYGDFDVKHTECIFEIPDGMNVKTLLQEFYDYSGMEKDGVMDSDSKKQLCPVVSKTGISGLKDSSKYLDLFCKWLKSRKCRIIKTHQISFSD